MDRCEFWAAADDCSEDIGAGILVRDVGYDSWGQCGATPESNISPDSPVYPQAISQATAHRQALRSVRKVDLPPRPIILSEELTTPADSKSG